VKASASVRGEGGEASPRRTPCRRSVRGPNDRGVTLVELVVVVLTISLLAGIAIPNFQRAILRARATSVVGDMNVVRVAVLNYEADRRAWPEDANRGQTPPGLEEYLPENFSFTREEFLLDYENWTGQSPGLIAVSILTDDEELGLAILDALGSNAWTNGSDRFTWVIQWID